MIKRFRIIVGAGHAREQKAIAGMARSYRTLGDEALFHKCPANVKMYA